MVNTTMPRTRALVALVFSLSLAALSGCKQLDSAPEPIDTPASQLTSEEVVAVRHMLTTPPPAPPPPPAPSPAPPVAQLSAEDAAVVQSLVTAFRPALVARAEARQRLVDAIPAAQRVLDDAQAALPAARQVLLEALGTPEEQAKRDLLTAANKAVTDARAALQAANEALVVFDRTPLISGGGSAGPKGDKGDKGDMGPPGRDGTNGTNGVDGTNGTNGADGRPGRDGNNGVVPTADLEAIRGRLDALEAARRPGGTPPPPPPR